MTMRIYRIRITVTNTTKMWIPPPRHGFFILKNSLSRLTLNLICSIILISFVIIKLNSIWLARPERRFQFA